MSVEKIVERSYGAYVEAQKFSSKDIAKLLRNIADEIENIGENLLQTASEETNLPIVRFEGERGRTCMQLRMFADLVEEGSWKGVSIDTAIPDRKPLPKVDIRLSKLPIGPIVVFGASNFPLAYSTAGGDTASALAAGCSVIYKAHPLHPKTSLLVANAIEKAIADNGFPKDYFIHYIAEDFNDVKNLVNHQLVQGVGFTGSVKGGLAIQEYTKERAQAIPVFAEMGSTNPVILMPHAMNVNAQKWAENYAMAITMGVGQFCTNPGLLFGIKGEGLENFAKILTQKIETSKDFQMLHKGIHTNYETRKNEILAVSTVSKIAESSKSADFTAIPTLARVSAKEFIKHPTLHEEVFGPFSMIVECEDINELKSLLDIVVGQLTSSIIFEESEIEEVRNVLNVIQHKAGRVVMNGVPTGVEVCNSMVHGGPFPSTTDGRFTSVGSNAIYRWVRPVSFQNCPQALLPLELQNENPLGIWRTLNGVFTKDAVHLG
ncbi:MAG: hypothetical protein RLZZ546_2090 [Bacteroidota bacterium]